MTFGDWVVLAAVLAGIVGYVIAHYVRHLSNAAIAADLKHEVVLGLAAVKGEVSKLLVHHQAQAAADPPTIVTKETVETRDGGNSVTTTRSVGPAGSLPPDPAVVGAIAPVVGPPPAGSVVPGYEYLFAGAPVFATAPSLDATEPPDGWLVQIPGWGSTGFKKLAQWYIDRYGDAHPPAGAMPVQNGTTEVGGMRAPWYGPKPPDGSEAAKTWQP